MDRNAVLRGERPERSLDYQAPTREELFARVRVLERAGDDLARVLDMFAAKFDGLLEGRVARDAAERWRASL